MIPVGLAFQGALAGTQLIGGIAAAASNRRPSLDPLQRNIAEAERIANSAASRATYGLDPYTRNMLLQRSRGAESAAAMAAREGGLTPAQVQAARVQGAVSQGANRLSVASQDAQVREAKQQYADAALRAVADPRTALYNEENAQYMQRAQSANALIGSGLQNVGNIGQDLSDISAQDRWAQQMQAFAKDFRDPRLYDWRAGYGQQGGMTMGKDGAYGGTIPAQSGINLGSPIQDAPVSGNPFTANIQPNPMWANTMGAPQATQQFAPPAANPYGFPPAYSPNMFGPPTRAQFAALPPSPGMQVGNGAMNFLQGMFGF